MPIYEYNCEACGHRLEAIQKISEKPLEECPACGQSRLKKLVSAAAFHLKGTGWYATDFKDKPKTDKKENKSEDKTSATKKSAESKKESSKTTTDVKTTKSSTTD